MVTKSTNYYHLRSKARKKTKIGEKLKGHRDQKLNTKLLLKKLQGVYVNINKSLEENMH